MITLDQCTFTAVKNRGDQWVGICQQFPNVKSAPRASKLAALDLVMDAVRDKLAEIEDKRTGTGAAPHAQ